jgi:uncharacterized integral membrane protein
VQVTDAARTVLQEELGTSGLTPREIGVNVSESDDRESTSETPSAPMADASVPAHDVNEKHRGEHFRHTRTSAAWVGIVVAIVFGVGLIDFIAQNTRDVRVDFFSASARIPVAVALLVAALSGAIVVVAVGIGRVAQLRLSMRREQRRHKAEISTKE